MKSSKHIWIVNPFDPLPNESDVPLRFWSLSKSLADEGYSVTWWSSDFSHLLKIRRLPCPDADGFSIKLIKTTPYKKNISLARINSHRTFSKNFYEEAMSSLKNNTIEKPFRIVVSLPPLEIAECAFRIKNYTNEMIKKDTTNSKLNSEIFCKVIVDVMDAWPEAFYRIFPKTIKHSIAPILIFPFHRRAMNAYKLADKISAVGQSYIEIAKDYINTYQKFFLKFPVKKKYKTQNLQKPMHLCYHGVDLKRFDFQTILNRTVEYKKLTKKIKLFQAGLFKFKKKEKVHLQIVYIGALNSGYDLQTVISVAEKWKNEGEIPIQIHFAGKGELLNTLKQKSKEFGLLEPVDLQNQKSKIIFHGQLKNDKINSLLLSSDLALVTNRSDTLVACPYKAGEYAGAGLPMISCLEGEFNNLLSLWNAGTTYKSENIKSLYDAIKKYSKDLELLKMHNLNARKMAENIFDREKTYKRLSKFIIDNN